MPHTRFAVVATLILAVIATDLPAQDELSRLYMVVADRTAQGVVRFDPETGELLDTLTRASVGQMEAVVFGPDQNLYGALSNVEYTVTVTDTATGRVKRYSNPAGEFASVGDTEAFRSLSGIGLPQW